MNKSVPTRILGPNGHPAGWYVPPVPDSAVMTPKPVSYYFFEGGTRRHGDTIPLWYWSGASDTRKLLRTYTWRQLLVCGRFLYANVPMIRGAVNEQADFGFPLERHYTGVGDPAWGEEAAEALKLHDQICTFRGPPFDAEMCSRQRLIETTADGDILTILTVDPKTDLPITQLVRAHRIGDRDGVADEGIISEGPFKGARIYNGIVTDRMGRPVGVLVLGDTEDQDQWIPAENAAMMYTPTYADQERGIGEMVASINSLDDLKRVNEYEMRAQQILASYAVIEKNETGLADEAQAAILRPDPNDKPDQGTTAAGLVTQTLEEGLIKYFRSGSGSGLEAFRGDRPSADCAAFEARIVARAFYGLGWDPNFAMLLKEPGGAWARITLQKVNRRLTRIQAREARIKHRIDVHTLSHLVYRLKVLRPPKDNDIFSWGYRGPARITADSGNEATAKRNDYILGLRTMEMHCIEDGRNWRHVRAQRKTETIALLTDAREVLEKFPELGTLAAAAKWLEDRSPATTPGLAPGAQPGAPAGAVPANPAGGSDDEEPEKEDGTDEDQQ